MEIKKQLEKQSQEKQFHLWTLTIGGIALVIGFNQKD